MIKASFQYLELRNRELEILKKLINYCQKELKRKKRKDKRIDINEIHILITHPVGVIGGLLTEGKQKNVIASAFIRRLIAELEGDMNISYEGRSVRFYPGRASVGLLKFPVDILERINNLIERGRLKIVETRSGKGRRTLRYLKD